MMLTAASGLASPEIGAGAYRLYAGANARPRAAARAPQFGLDGPNETPFTVWNGLIGPQENGGKARHHGRTGRWNAAGPSEPGEDRAQSQAGAQSRGARAIRRYP
jgi:hypothetical protein